MWYTSSYAVNKRVATGYTPYLSPILRPPKSNTMHYFRSCISQSYKQCYIYNRKADWPLNFSA